MRLVDLPAPPVAMKTEIWVPNRDCLGKLLRHLEQAGWEWRSGKPPTHVRPRWGMGYLLLNTDGTLTQWHASLGPDIGSIVVDDWSEGSVPMAAESVAAAYCLCASPKVEQRFAGIGSCGSWYNFCLACRRERR
jgi:hypothetical protein